MALQQIPFASLAVRPRVVTAFGWSVTSCELSDGVVRIVSGPDCLYLAVGDQAAGLDHRTHVTLHADGSVTVRAASTPPALLISASTARTLPQVPGVPEHAHPQDGDRLMVLSAGALEALPESLASVLLSLPANVAGRDPAELLPELFADLAAGSGLIAVRAPQGGERTRPDQWMAAT